MIKSLVLRSSPVLVEAKDIHGRAAEFSKTRLVSSIRCSRTGEVPKLEPFSRSNRLDRIVKDPPLIEKAETELADYCSTLEGDESYRCWRAYFELKDLEREAPREEVERLILQTGGIKSLIGCLHGISSMHKEKQNGMSYAKTLEAKKDSRVPFHIPDGLPKSQEELEEEEKAKMPDSPFTRLLRTKGTFPAWYSPAPDHETD